MKKDRDSRQDEPLCASPWNMVLFAAGLPVYFAMKWQRRREPVTLAAADPTH